ncbi:hypothetical protein DICPUDRAFT_160114 [Dictyostelium purpureum]|uniref:Uncharacterized protein n=1 Tax=Dictyostelium purpureum TaxID=5786 RepID=F1A5R2_DICPU|nr:uncharacterized protein DICPUDRAFT_160114 [Dictyostelium purpureum]EGC28466.1 hypothetical protein DICPUDRAFT_160114 [Dictyostelium purpureum]|eukprot:XP_003295006.1 hypothetical protein DICPUDRAFT_160114 [Dictyostelium purpureum]
MSCQSFIIFDEFESNKENIDPLTGFCSNVSHNLSNKSNKKRVPLRDITHKTSKSSSDNKPMATFLPPAFNLTVKPSPRNNTPVEPTIRSIR